MKMPRTAPLPIDALIPAIAGSLEREPNLLIVAEPGAGKTTRVPSALLGAVTGNVLVLEPRRLAARLAARRVAWEMGEEPGHTVGYQVRFERVASEATRLHFLTEGVLTRRLLSDPLLDGVDAVVLDEFHERHLETDLALALLRNLQRKRPALKLVVMSATLDAEPVARFLGGCPVIRSQGRAFPLTVDHLPYSPAPLEEQVRGAVERLIGEGETGSILVFLPGAAEIRRAMRACEPAARRSGRLLLPLYGDLPAAEQDRAVAPSSQSKIVLATNVAESSVTIDGVTAVVDSGLARRASWSQWTGLPTLAIGRISQASATQRAGRAGRTAPGHVLRLYTQMDFSQRTPHETPEILRGDLAQLCLLLRAMGFDDPRELEWLDPPPDAAVEQAAALLDSLGATGSGAKKLMRIPVHPRLARMIESAAGRGVGLAACMTAALLESGTRRAHCDLLTALDEPLDERTRQQLRALVRLAKPGSARRDDDNALLECILLGFPDRVARRRTASQITLANGVAAELAGELPPWPFLIALDVEDRTEKALPLVRLAARVEPEWLLDNFPERIREEDSVVWNRQAERVDALSRLLYDGIVLEESNNAAPDPATAAALLAEHALEAGIERFADGAQLEEWLGRLEFAGLPAPDLAALFPEFCAGMRSFADLRAACGGFLAWLEQRLDAHRLRDVAPLTLQLTASRKTKIHYERGKTPWIASYLQDFFGRSETPRIGPGRTPLVLHLLAPNRRPVQTTTDLAGFWERLYPQVRRELMRRYPRHAWPEQPVK
ncbi:MAG: ATP-dependent helicase HrpB [Terracidiphilus sp.]|nr:ATP-dependent helicase HrpB [Terracidiphilus sp.]